MFDLLFGWRKASKCKKLIRRVQCRLKLLKNKRCCIVKQLKQDVAELLKHGHDHTAFDRVEQLVKDQNAIDLYDLLEQYCEFIIINLPYIRKHKDCPNDVNEAVSTLIFSSARFGELPELLSIRKLFEQRYGQRFVKAALELLPGNLVKKQIKENLYIEKVPDDAKYRLMAEIATSCIEPGPLFLEYKPEPQEEQATKDSNWIKSREVQMQNVNEAPELELYNVAATDGMIKHVDLSREHNKNSKRKDHISPNTIQKFNPGELEESLSETSAKLPEEMIYLDDIEEIVSPVGKDGNLQDQRLFMFRSFGSPLKEKTDYGIGQKALSNGKLSSRSSRKMRRKRSRKRSLSQENNVTDIECATYYGASDESSPDNSKRKSHHYHRERGNKILDSVKVESNFKLVKSRDDKLELSCTSKSNAEKCSLEHSHDIRMTDENYASESASRPQKLKTREAAQPAYLRALTMPAERPNESLTENIFRSKSFPFEQPHTSCKHIHPKLPDYDELAAKFTALKQEKLHGKRRSSLG